MGFVRSAVRAIASIFRPSVPTMPQPQVAQAPTLTTAARQPEAPAQRTAQQATRQATETERRIAAVSGQPNLTNVLSQQDEQAPGARARRRALGV